MPSKFLRTIKKKDKDGNVIKVYKKYYAKFMVDGKEIRRTLKTKERGKANTALQNFKPNVDQSKDLRLLEREVLTTVRASCNQYTIYNYTNTFKLFIELIGNKLISQVTKNNIIAYRTFRQNSVKKNGQPFNNSSINHEIMALKRAFNVAIDEHWLDRNPCRNIKPLPVKRVRRPYEVHEIDLVMNRLKEKDFERWCAMIVTFNCGLRRSEASSLKDSQIDYANRTMILTNKMDGKEEIIGFNQTVYDILMELKKNPIKDINGSIYSKPFSGQCLYQTVKNIIIELKLPPGLCIHSARHTAGTKWVNAYGIHIGQKMLRHRSIQMTEKYYHPKDKEIQLLSREIKVT
jgi:integrase